MDQVPILLDRSTVKEVERALAREAREIKRISGVDDHRGADRWIEGAVLRSLDERQVRMDGVHRFTVEEYLKICELLDLDDPELIDGVIYDAVKY